MAEASSLVLGGGGRGRGAWRGGDRGQAPFHGFRHGGRGGGGGTFAHAAPYGHALAMPAPRLSRRDACPFTVMALFGDAWVEKVFVRPAAVFGAWSTWDGALSHDAASIAPPRPAGTASSVAFARLWSDTSLQQAVHLCIRDLGGLEAARAALGAPAPVGGDAATTSLGIVVDIVYQTAPSGGLAVARVGAVDIVMSPAQATGAGGTKGGAAAAADERSSGTQTATSDGASRAAPVRRPRADLRRPGSCNTMTVGACGIAGGWVALLLTLEVAGPLVPLPGPGLLELPPSLLAPEPATTSDVNGAA
jgi:hypothetical protein